MADVTDIPAGETIDGLGIPDIPPGETPDLIVPGQTGSLDMLAGSFKGGARQNTLIGAANISEATKTMRRGGDNPEYQLSPQARRRRTLDTLGGGRTDDEGLFNPQLAEEQTIAAQRKVIEQIAYEESQAFSGGVAGAAGTALGSIVAPESFLGFGGALAARFPTVFAGSSYGRVMLRSGVDAAIGNTLTDPLVQGIRIGSGIQSQYDWTQTLIESPLTGLAGGAVLGAAGTAAARFLGDLPFSPLATTNLKTGTIGKEMMNLVEGQDFDKVAQMRAAIAGMTADNARYKANNDPDVIDTTLFKEVDIGAYSKLGESAPDSADISAKPPEVPSLEKSVIDQVTDDVDAGFQPPRPLQDIEATTLATKLDEAFAKIKEDISDAEVERAIEHTLAGKPPEEAIKLAKEETAQSAPKPGETPEAAKQPEVKAPEAKPPEPTLAQPLPTDGPQKFTMIQVTGKKGTNEGGFFKDEATGQEFYVKFYKNPNQSKVEELAGKIYNLFGAETLSPKTAEINGKFGVYTPKTTDLKQIDPAKLDAKQMEDLAKIYYSAVMTGNRDIVGDSFDNIMLNTKTGRLVQTDLGGSFEFRAQGEAKKYTADVKDADAFLDAQYSAGKFFSKLSSENKGRLLLELKKLHYSESFSINTNKAMQLISSYNPSHGQSFILKNFNFEEWIDTQLAKTQNEIRVKLAQGEVAIAQKQTPSAEQLKKGMTAKAVKTETDVSAKKLEALSKELDKAIADGLPNMQAAPVKAVEVTGTISKVVSIIETVQQKDSVTKADINKIFKAASTSDDVRAKLIADVAKAVVDAKPKQKVAAFNTMKVILNTPTSALTPQKDVPTAFTTLKQNTTQSGDNYFIKWVNDLEQFVGDYKNAEARVDSGLPMDTASRTARAKALGFNTEITFYHGAKWAFDKFDLKKAKNGEIGIFLTTEKHIAKNYAAGKYIIPLWMKMENPKVVDWHGSGYSNSKMVAAIKSATAAGHDVLVVKNMVDLGGKQDQYIALDPTKLRAKHGAAFDPTKKDVADLLALNKNKLPDFAPNFKDSIPVHGTETPAGHSPIPKGRVMMAQQIAQELVEGLNLTVRIGMTGPGNRGLYKSRSGVIRVYGAQDLEALFHEVGHDVHINGGKKQLFDDFIDTHAKQLDILNAGDLSKPENAQEAVAHFFWGYISAPNYLRRFAPDAFKDFDLLMRSNFPEHIAVIEKTRNNLDIFNHASSVERVQASQISTQKPTTGQKIATGAKDFVATGANIVKETISGGGKGFTPAVKEAMAHDMDPFSRPVFSVMDNLYARFVDKNHPIYKAQQALVEIGKVNGVNVDLKPIDDAYIHARMMPYSFGRAASILQNGNLNGVDHYGPSIHSALEKAKITQANQERFSDFSAYLVARRMLEEYERKARGEIPRNPGPLSRDDYYNYVLEAETSNPEFAEAAKDIHEFLKNHAKYMFDNHLVTKAQYDGMMKMKDYVPLHRDMTAFVDREVQLRGSQNPKQLINGFVRRFEGSDRIVINPIESIIKRVTEIEYAIGRNNAIRSLAILGKNAGYNGGYIAEIIPSNKLAAHEVDVYDAIKKAGKEANINKTDMDMLLIQAEDLLGENSTATIFKQEKIKVGNDNRNVVFFWENGERKALWLHDGKLGEEMFHAFTQTSAFETNAILQTLQLSQAVLRNGVTMSLDFPLVNLIRDQMTASLTAGKKYIPFLGVVTGLLETVGSKDTALAKELAKLGFDGTHAKRFAAFGGTSGGAITNAIDEMGFNHSSVAFMPKGGHDMKSIARGMLGFTAKAAEFSEVGTRVGLYKAYFDQGKELGYDDVNAALWATFKANDYIDFRKHGRQMDTARRLIPFLNAYLQGTDRELRAVKDWMVLNSKLKANGSLSAQEQLRLQDANRGVFRLITLAVIVGGSFALMNAENPFYQSAPRYVKDLNFILPGSMDENGNAVVIPKGFGVTQVLVNAMEMGIDQAYRRDPQLNGNALKMLGTAFAPPMHNPAVALFYDLPANWNRFRERPIVPYYMRGVDAPEQYNAYTSELAKLVGKATGVSPLKIEYAINNTFGGWGRDAQFLSNMMAGNSRPETQIYDYPVTRRFYKNLPRGNLMTAAFYDLVGQGTGTLEAKAAAFSLRIQNGNRSEAAELYKGMKDEEKIWTALTKFGFETAEKRLHPLYRAHDIVQIGNALSRSVTAGNVLREEELDRRNLTLSRRDATPINLTPHQRAKLQEELLEYNMATTRNAMIAIRAPGTNNLENMDVDKVMNRIGLISPEFRKEFEARIASKNLQSEKYVYEKWPELRRRILQDGEDADLSDLTPAKPRRNRR